MIPTEIGPAIARILMLAASSEDDGNTVEVAAAVAAFDDEVAVTELACTVAVSIAGKIGDRPAGLPILDVADLLAFGMISHAIDHGRTGLDEHLAQLPLAHRAWVSVSLLAYWRLACAAAAQQTLATITVPEEPPA